MHRSLAARLSARVSELVLSEQQARMAQRAVPQAGEAEASACAMQQHIEALQARLEQKDQVKDKP